MTPSIQPDPADPSDQMRPLNWFGIWGLVVVLFLALLTACIYRVVTAGFVVFTSSEPFQWLAIATLAVFVCIAGRTTVHKFKTGFIVDARNSMDMSRSQWGNRWRSKG